MLPTMTRQYWTLTIPLELLKKGPMKQDVPSGFMTVSIMPSKRSKVVGSFGANVIMTFTV